MIMFRGDHHFSLLFQKLKSWTVPKIASCTCKEIPQMNFECRKENSLVEFHILPKWKPWRTVVAMRCQRPENVYKTNTRSTISRKKKSRKSPSTHVLKATLRGYQFRRQRAAEGRAREKWIGNRSEGQALSKSRTIQAHVEQVKRAVKIMRWSMKRERRQRGRQGRMVK